ADTGAESAASSAAVALVVGGSGAFGDPVGAGGFPIEGWVAGVAAAVDIMRPSAGGLDDRRTAGTSRGSNAARAGSCCSRRAGLEQESEARSHQIRSHQCHMCIV